MRAVLALLALAFPLSAQRFAVYHDGNIHDKDDIGASAMSLALIWQAGAQDDCALFVHSSTVGAVDLEQHADMIESVMGQDYGVDTIVDGWKQTRLAIRRLATEINASGPDNPLTIIQGGPWELMALGFDYSNPAKHQFVSIVSHSSWNDTYKQLGSHRNKDSFYGQYASGGKWSGVVGPAYTKIVDQNGPGFAQDAGLAPWAWLLDGPPELQHVYHRTAASDYAAGDMSDAGMVFWMFTGQQFAQMDDIQGYFGEKKAGLSESVR